MEKISKIIPSSARTLSVDMSKERPVRPGTPTFGRPEGRNEIKDRITRSSLAIVDSPAELRTYRNPKEMQRAQIVEDMAKKFFGENFRQHGRTVVAEEPLIETAVEPTLPEEQFVFEESVVPETASPFSKEEIQRELNSRPLRVNR